MSAVTVTLAFASLEQALQNLLALKAPVVYAPLAVDANFEAEFCDPQSLPLYTETPAAQTEKKPRKPRADAGKPRGSYKTTGGPAASEPGLEGGVSASAPQPVAPATPTQTAAGDGAALTKEDAHAALKRISDTKNLGTPACIGHLKLFGVNRLTDLKPGDYAEFILQADKLVASATTKTA